jgi:hypothetical protein
LGYIPEAVEPSFNNSEDCLVAPDLIIASTQLHHTIVFEWKSGRNTDADQLQRYSRVVPADLIAKAYIHVNKCATHDVSIIGQDEHRETLPIGVVNGGHNFPVMVTAAAGIEIIRNAFTSAPTDSVFRPLVIDWETLPMTFFPLDADSELWEYAEQIIPHVLEDMAKGSNRIVSNDLGAKLHFWRDMRPDYKGLLKQKINQVMNHASRREFSKYLQRNTTARAVTQSLSWDIIDNPLIGASDKRQKAWKTMRKKQETLIAYFKGESRQEVLEMDDGQAV